MHTGNTWCIRDDGLMLAVYPRAYGEHIPLIIVTVIRRGLSPCIRGTPVRNQFFWRLHRFIPCIRGTHATRGIAISCRRFIPVHTGNTKASSRTYIKRAVYPRAYGEHGANEGVYRLGYGLSPCIRGTQCHH